MIESRDLTQEYLEKEMSRRRMVQSTMLGAVGAWALASGCSSDPTTNPTPTDGGTDAQTDTGPTGDTNPPPTTHLVGMGYHETDHDAAIRAALAETVGFRAIQRGQRVYLKVNTNSGDPFPYSTSPDTIRLVVGMLRDLGAEVFIGDRSFYGDTGTMRNFTNNGIAGIASELGVQLMVFDGTGVDWMDLPATDGALGERSTIWDGTMRIPAVVAQADHIINLPVIKTHFIATFTMSMKNFIGLIHPTDRSRSRNLGSHGSNLHRQVAFMNKSGPTATMNLLDGWEAVIQGGPTPRDTPGGITAEPHVVVASVDKIAADVTGLAVLKTLSPSSHAIQRTTVWQNAQIRAAVAGGFGITGPERYDLSGPTVPADRLTTYRNNVVGS